MKKVIILLISILILTVASGCSQQPAAQNTGVAYISTEDATDKNLTTDDVSESKMDDIDSNSNAINAEETDDNDISSVTDISEATAMEIANESADITNTQTNSDKTIVNTSADLTTDVCTATNDMPAQSTTTDATITTDIESKCTGSDNQADQSIENIEPSSPYDVVATEGTEELLAERMVYYINKYREEEGNVTATELPGLTEYAKYRSGQLTENFAHDKHDERAAATALKYGRYVDPMASGYDVDPYYDPMAQEAIGMSANIYVRSVDQMAKKLIDGFRNSKGHWNYVGAATEFYKECKFIAIGATYKNGAVYVCVCVTDTAQYG